MSNTTEKQPTEIDEDGTKYWKRNGVLHREDGPAILTTDGSYAWYFNGKLHRNGDEPAISRPTIQFWYKNGLRHRTKGPAIIRNTGENEYWVENQEYSEKEFLYLSLEDNLNKNLHIKNKKSKV